jgi:hypothetical protein
MRHCSYRGTVAAPPHLKICIDIDIDVIKYMNHVQLMELHMMDEMEYSVDHRKLNAYCKKKDFFGQKNDKK